MPLQETEAIDQAEAPEQLQMLMEILGHIVLTGLLHQQEVAEHTEAVLPIEILLLDIELQEEVLEVINLQVELRHVVATTIDHPEVQEALEVIGVAEVTEAQEVVEVTEAPGAVQEAQEATEVLEGLADLLAVQDHHLAGAEEDNKS